MHVRFRKGACGSTGLLPSAGRRRLVTIGILGAALCALTATATVRAENGRLVTVCRLLEGIDLADITRVHTVLVWCFLATALVLAIRLQHHGAKAAPVAQWLLVVITIQGAIGYLQYAIGVPPALVEAHIFGSIIVWTTVIYLQLQLFDRPELDEIINGPEPPDQHRQPPSRGDRVLDEEKSRTQVVNAAPTLAKMKS